MSWQGINKLPSLFTEGGYFGKAQTNKDSQDEVRVHAVMAWVSAHEVEHRQVMQGWGRMPESAVGGHTAGDWWTYRKPAFSADDPIFGHEQLQITVGYQSRSVRGHSSIVRAAPGERMHTAFEGRDVCIVGLPELFLANLYTRTAKDLYTEWLDAEVIIGKKHPQGQKRCSNCT